MTHTLDYTLLHSLIEKYFDATSSLDEERTLRQMLADPAYQSDEADEARAVMSISVVAPAPQIAVRPRRKAIFHPLAAAASVAVLLALGITMITYSGSHDSDLDCMAYIGGKRIESRAAVMSIVSSDLDALGEVQQETADDIVGQLSEFSSLFNDI